MKCPTCGSAGLVRQTRDLPYTYKGARLVIPGVSGDFCPDCDESLLDAAQSSRVMEAMGQFQRQINASAGHPQFIAGVRRKLALGQREAAEIFGGGVNAFSRYETGKTQPPLALLQLLRLLDRHPQLLEELRPR